MESKEWIFTCEELLQEKRWSALSVGGGSSPATSAGVGVDGLAGRAAVVVSGARFDASPARRPGCGSLAARRGPCVGWLAGTPAG